MRSKNEYRQIPNYKKFKKIEKNEKLSKRFFVYLENIFIVSVSRFFDFVFSVIRTSIDYILFILPLLVSVFIFVHPEMVDNIMGSQKYGGGVSDYIGRLNFWSRMIISLPLWWISWFGQRNISHNKRLSEEYNHKAQVTKMYLNFSSRNRKENSIYPISDKARDELDLQLIKVIKRHPGAVYGKDETMMDKVIQAIQAFKGNENIEENNNDIKDEQDDKK